jgi:nitrite reductase (NADH) small subunit
MPSSIKLAAVSDVPLNQSKCFRTAAGTIALFHQPDGFYALDDACPHRDGPLSEGPVKDGAVACPWHQWLFRLKDGVCTNIPGPKVKTYPVQIIKDEIWITL